MIRLQQKKDAAVAAQKLQQETIAAENVALKSSSDINTAPAPVVSKEGVVEGEEGAAALSVLGIGGKQLRTGAAKKLGTKKRTPGEIRIQKGSFISIHK